LSGVGTESRTVYSLKKDMDELRADGAAKGIVDAGVVDVGKSWGPPGKELWALKLGTGSAHKVLFTGCHHAREWISVEIPYLVAEYLVRNYRDPPTTDKERRIKHLLANREIWFVPMVNPDGHEYTTTVDREWRANRKPYALPAATITAPRLGGGNRTISYPAGTYTGVDINRNYGTASWGQETFKFGFVKTSRDPRQSGANSIWCGPSPSSEMETKAIDALFKREKFRASITYHNFSQLLLYPDAAAADVFVQDVGNGMNALIAEHGNPYTYQSGSALYATTGDLMDFSYETSPGRPTFTPELRPPDPPPVGHEFSGLPEGEIEPCFQENLGAALALINCAGFDKVVTEECEWVFAWPPRRCQVVQKCWEVFRGWTP
jgi:carboxypeptidase T